MTDREMILIGVGLSGLLMFAIVKIGELVERRKHRKHKHA